MFENWLRALGKLDYVQGKAKPDVDCILCAIRDNDERVVSLKFYEDDLCTCLHVYRSTLNWNLFYYDYV